MRQPARGARTAAPRTHVLDARGLLCPMPLIRLQDFVASVPGGDLIEVLCTDPGTRSDIPAWCRLNGHRLVGVREQSEGLVITLSVGDAEGRHS
ncbi:MAG: sulfurtransferase TusA family protein [Gammaproteobacteria bacterium]|nr:sulfurtransferase TusA family protein [Gammaproteobacteria bacterium]